MKAEKDGIDSFITAFVILSKYLPLILGFYNYS